MIYAVPTSQEPGVVPAGLVGRADEVPAGLADESPAAAIHAIRRDHPSQGRGAI